MRLTRYEAASLRHGSQLQLQNFLAFVVLEPAIVLSLL